MRHNHHDLTAHDELVANRVAHEFHRLVEGEVARHDRLNRLKTIRWLRRLFLVRGARREVIFLMRLGNLRLDGARRCTENKVEASLLRRDIRTVIVTRGLTEEFNRVNNCRRRLKRNAWKLHLFHAPKNCLLLRTLGVIARLRLHCLRRRHRKLRRIRRVGRTPRLIHISDHHLARRCALLLTDKLTLLTDCAPNAKGLFIIRIRHEHNIALRDGLLHIAQRKILARTTEVATNLFAQGLVARIALHLTSFLHRILTLGRGARLPLLKHTLRLRVTPVARLRHIIQRRRAETTVPLLNSRTVERGGDALLATVAKRLRRLAVAQEFDGTCEVANRLVVLLILHRLARLANLALGLFIERTTAETLHRRNIVEKLIVGARRTRHGRCRRCLRIKILPKIRIVIGVIRLRLLHHGRNRRCRRRRIGHRRDSRLILRGRGLFSDNGLFSRSGRLFSHSRRLGH